jgi:hypothetical protein
MINLIELIQKNLGYSELHKIDPNTQDIKTDEKNFGMQTTTQAAIPAIVCGLCYKLGTSQGMERLLSAENKQWMDIIFGKEKDELISSIANYSNIQGIMVEQECDHIANEAVRLLKENLPGTTNPAGTALFLAEQRANALLYLPAALQLGKLLNDNQLDDRTHKMEGPVSSLMHSMEKQF